MVKQYINAFKIKRGLILVKTTFVAHIPRKDTTQSSLAAV